MKLSVLITCNIFIPIFKFPSNWMIFVEKPRSIYWWQIKDEKGYFVIARFVAIYQIKKACLLEHDTACAPFFSPSFVFPTTVFLRWSSIRYVTQNHVISFAVWR